MRKCDTLSLAYTADHDSAMQARHNGVKQSGCQGWYGCSQLLQRAVLWIRGAKLFSDAVCYLHQHDLQAALAYQTGMLSNPLFEQVPTERVTIEQLAVQAETNSIWS